MKNLNSVKDSEKRALIVSTEPLIDESWNRIEGLMVFADGRRVI